MHFSSMQFSQSGMNIHQSSIADVKRWQLNVLIFTVNGFMLLLPTLQFECFFFASKIDTKFKTLPLPGTNSKINIVKLFINDNCLQSSLVSLPKNQTAKLWTRWNYHFIDTLRCIKQFLREKNHWSVRNSSDFTLCSKGFVHSNSLISDSVRITWQCRLHQSTKWNGKNPKKGRRDIRLHSHSTSIYSAAVLIRVLFIFIIYHLCAKQINRISSLAYIIKYNFSSNDDNNNSKTDYFIHMFVFVHER